MSSYKNFIDSTLKDRGANAVAAALTVSAAGPAVVGQPYIVGERGPEWFVLDRGQQKLIEQRAVLCQHEVAGPEQGADTSHTRETDHAPARPVHQRR